jgi:hypothetical protein
MDSLLFDRMHYTFRWMEWFFFRDSLLYFKNLQVCGGKACGSCLDLVLFIDCMTDGA